MADFGRRVNHVKNLMSCCVIISRVFNISICRVCSPVAFLLLLGCVSGGNGKLLDRPQPLSGYRGFEGWEVGVIFSRGESKFVFFLCIKFNARSWCGHGLVDLLGGDLRKIKEN